jgi:hypothetical protein
MPNIEFTIHVESPKQLRSIKVYIYETLSEMHDAAERFDIKHHNSPGTYGDLLGVTHRFERIDVMNDKSYTKVAIIRMQKDNIGAGIISHESTHAAVWIYQIDCEGWSLEDIQNEEIFCHMVSDITRSIVNKCYDNNLYKDEK